MDSAFSDEQEFREGPPSDVAGPPAVPNTAAPPAAAAPPPAAAPAPASPHSQTGSPTSDAAGAAPSSKQVKAPWEDDDDWGQPSQPANPPPPQPSQSQDSIPSAHQDPVPQVPEEREEESASEEEQAPPPPPPAEKDNSAAMEAINRQIANRTAALDKETKEKETKILAAAQAYLKEMATKRDKDVSNSKEIHKKEQQAGVQKVDQLKKSGAVWTSVGMLVDLQKPNPHSKGTERMRTLFNTLNEVKVA